MEPMIIDPVTGLPGYSFVTGPETMEIGINAAAADDWGDPETEPQPYEPDDDEDDDEDDDDGEDADAAEVDEPAEVLGDPRPEDPIDPPVQSEGGRPDPEAA